MEKKQRFGGRSSWQRRNGCTKSLGPGVSSVVKEQRKPAFMEQSAKEAGDGCFRSQSQTKPCYWPWETHCLHPGYH